MDEPWYYRLESVDGPCRIGSFRRADRSLPLPALIDRVISTEEVVPLCMLTSPTPGWEGVGLSMDNDGAMTGPWEDAILDTMRRKGLERIEGAVRFHRRTLRADREPLPAIVAGPAQLLSDDSKALAGLLSALSMHGPAAAAMLPGIAGPDNLEALLYLGVELFDTSRAHLDASDSIYYTMEGTIDLGTLRRRLDPGLMCGCEHCRSGLPSAEAIGSHNVAMMHRRLAYASAMAHEGRLRPLVMGRLSGSPVWAAVVRRIETGAVPDVTGSALTYRKPGPVPVTYRDDTRSPDFGLWAKRVREEYMPPSGRTVLLLLPCSAKKPYSASRTHHRIRSALARVKGWMDHCQQVVLTSPLGAVPMEMDILYPPAYYDIPVTGEWFPEEIDLMRDLVGAIALKGDYSTVICHHPEGGEIFGEELASGSLRGIPFEIANGLDALRERLEELLLDLPPPALGHRAAEISSLLRLSLGGSVPGPERLRYRIRGDRTEILLGNLVLAEVRIGGPVPTFPGGKALWEMGAGRKVIIDDFVPKGTVFTQGIQNADPTIRAGDIVLVGTQDRYKGVGRAILPSSLLTGGNKGPGIRMISHK